MPDTSGQSSVPIRGDSEHPDRDRLARVEENLSRLADAVYELAAQYEADRAADARAAAIIRRAASPDRPRRTSSPRRGRRGGPVLYVVRAALIAVLGVGAVLALMAPRHLQQLRYTPGAAVQVAHVHNDHDADDR